MAEKKIINSLVKALKILECFSIETKELRLTDIAKMLDMPKSTASNLIYTMESMGYIEQNKDNGKFKLGTKLFILGKAFEYHTDIIEIARPYMEKLRNKFNENIQLSMPYDENGIVEGICVEKAREFNTVSVNSRVGGKIPLHCTASRKLFLSSMDNETLYKTLDKIELFKRTENTITDKNVLKEDILRVKNQGYAMAIEEGELGITSIAVPIYEYNSQFIASLSIAAPSVRLSGEIGCEIINDLLKLAKDISEKLGYKK